MNRVFAVFFVTVLSLAFIQGCSSPHMSIVNDIQAGTALTKADVEARQGLPTDVKNMSDGREIWIYKDYAGIIPAIYYYYFDTDGHLTYFRREADRNALSNMMR